MNDQRLDHIEKELTRINQRIDHLKILMLGPQATSMPSSSSTTVTPTEPTPAPTKPHSSMQLPQVNKVSAIGQYASLGALSVLFFLLAALYALNLAYQSGFITPQGILLLLTAVGVGLVVSGYFPLSVDKKFQSFLPLTGILVLNAVFYTASTYYGLVGSGLALLITMGLAALSIFLYEEFKSDIYWIISVLGAYFFSALLKLQADIYVWQIFLLISSVGFATAGVLVHKRAISLMACICAFIAVSSRRNELVELQALVFMSLHFLVFLSGFVLNFKINKQLLADFEAKALFTVGVFFFVYANILTQTAGLNTQLVFSVVTGLTFLGLRYLVLNLLSETQKNESNALDAIHSLNYFIVAYTGFVVAHLEHWRPVFFISFAGATVYFLKSFLNATEKFFFKVVSVSLGVMFFVEYGQLLFLEGSTYHKIYWLWFLMWGFTFLASEKKLSALHYFKTLNAKFWMFYYGLGHILLLKLIWLLSEEFGLTDFRVIYVALYAGLSVFLGFQFQLRNLAKSALPLLFLISVLLLFGLGMGNALTKVFSFLGAGVTFWAAGFILRKIDKIT